MTTFFDVCVRDGSMEPSMYTFEDLRKHILAKPKNTGPLLSHHALLERIRSKVQQAQRAPVTAVSTGRQNQPIRHKGSAAAVGAKTMDAPITISLDDSQEDDLFPVPPARQDKRKEQWEDDDVLEAGDVYEPTPKKAKSYSVYLDDEEEEEDVRDYAVDAEDRVWRNDPSGKGSQTELDLDESQGLEILDDVNDSPAIQPPSHSAKKTAVSSSYRSVTPREEEEEEEEVHNTSTSWISEVLTNRESQSTFANFGSTSKFRRGKRRWNGGSGHGEGGDLKRIRRRLEREPRSSQPATPSSPSPHLHAHRVNSSSIDVFVVRKALRLTHQQPHLAFVYKIKCFCTPTLRLCETKTLRAK